MPDDLYTADILLWSDQQADLLRRLARGERVNDAIDWDHVIEEVESVGRSERHAVESLLTRAMEHLLKLHGWPDGPGGHWRHEARVFLSDAAARWTPSMRQTIELALLYATARGLVSRMTVDERPPAPLPAVYPYTLDDLIVPRPAVADIDALLAHLTTGV